MSLISQVQSLKVATWNIWAPCYNRRSLGGELEALRRDAWVPRAQKICRTLEETQFDIACLQEYWFNPEMREIFESTFKGTHHLHYLQRKDRHDGLLTIIRKADPHSVTFDMEPGMQMGDDIADDAWGAGQVRMPGPGRPPLDVALIKPIYMPPSGCRVALLMVLQVLGCPFILINTHLQYPGKISDAGLRFRQVRTILKEARAVIEQRRLAHVPVLFCGDMNGRDNDTALKQLQGHSLRRGFGLPRNMHLTPTINIRKARGGRARDSVVTHCDHAGNHVGVDYIFYTHPKRLVRGRSMGESLPASLQSTPVQTSRTFDLSFMGLGDHATGGVPGGVGGRGTSLTWDAPEASSNGPGGAGGVVSIPHSPRPGSTLTAGCVLLNHARSTLWPPGLSWERWPDDAAYSLSDHRMLMSEFELDFE